MKNKRRKKKDFPRLRTDSFKEWEWKLFEKFAPCIAFDNNEMLFPIKVGCSIIYRKTHPPNLIQFYKRRHPRVKLFKFLENVILTFIYGRPPIFYKLIRDRFQPVLPTTRHGFSVKRAAMILEYGFYYDADIQHIYELEHVWVYLDEHAKIMSVKATQHGKITTIYETPKSIKYHNNHPLLYASPGKHALYKSPNKMNRRILSSVNQKGADRVLDVHFFDEKMWKKIVPYYPGKGKIRLYFLENFTNLPTFRYKRFLIPKRPQLIPWDILEALVPDRVIAFLQKIQAYFDMDILKEEESKVIDVPST